MRRFILAAVCSTLAVNVAAAGADSQPLRHAVAGGEVTTVAKWPWMVQLRGSVVCGGSIIARGWVLTAAHCVTNRDTGEIQGVRVYTGRSTLDPPEDLEEGAAHGQEELVLEVIRHPEYSHTSTRNDVALLRLAPSPTPGRIRLMGPKDKDAHEDDERWPEGQKASVLGWGLTTPGGQEPSNELRHARIPIVPDRNCSATDLGRSYYDRRTMLCAGSTRTPRSDTCKGDSGGPLMVRSGGGYVLAGVMNWGSPECAQGNQPSAFASVGENPLREWILETIDSRVIRMAEDNTLRQIGGLKFDDRSATSIGDAVKAFGEPAVSTGELGTCKGEWPPLGLELWAYANAEASAENCHTERFFFSHARFGGLRGMTWETDRKLTLGSTRKRMLKLYPKAKRFKTDDPDPAFPGAETWGLTWYAYGVEGRRKSATLQATVANGQVVSMRVDSPEAGY